MPASAAGPPPAPLTGACPAELTATGWTDSDRPTEARNRPTVCYTRTLRKRRRKERGGRKGERGLVVPATSQACVKIGAKLRAALGQGCASLLCVSGASTKHRPCRAKRARLRDRPPGSRVQLLALPPTGWLTSYRGLSLLHLLFSQTENGDTTSENHTRPVTVRYAYCYYHNVY